MCVYYIYVRVCVCVCVLCAGNDLLAVKPWQVIQTVCSADSALWVPHLVSKNWVSEVLGMQLMEMRGEGGVRCSWRRWRQSWLLSGLPEASSSCPHSCPPNNQCTLKVSKEKCKRPTSLGTATQLWTQLCSDHMWVVQNAWKDRGSSSAGNEKQRT